MKKIRYAVAGFAMTLLMASLFVTSPAWAKRSHHSSLSISQDRLKALAKYTQVVQTIEKYYVDEENITDIVNKSLEGLLANLDAHSSFMTKKQFKELKIQTEGEFGGLGITVGMREGALTVIAPIEGTPADRAGLKAGDIILKIDDKATLNMTIDEAVSLMRGKPGTDIHLTIVRKDTPKPFVVKITRAIIKVDSVYAKKIDETGFLYIRVTSFDKKVARDVKKAIEANRSGLKGIVLDLRNNPGGLLSQAIGLVDLFVDKGVIVSQKGRLKSENQVYRATAPGTYKDIPLVVLINAGSASASEIVSGALQDHKRAVLVGEKSFGKGSVQVILPLGDGEGLRLTVARYYLPSGRTIQAKGVTPDIHVYPGKVPVKKDEFAIKEKELKKHLKEELAKVDGKKHHKKAKNRKKILTQEDILNDIQLKTAIDALKVLTITKEGGK